MSAKRRLVIGLTSAIVVTGFLASTSSFAAPPKLFICHATSSAGNPYVAIAVPGSSGFEPHLDDNAQPLAGHEQDFLSDSRACDKVVEPPK